MYLGLFALRPIMYSCMNLLFLHPEAFIVKELLELSELLFYFILLLKSNEQTAGRPGEKEGTQT